MKSKIGIIYELLEYGGVQTCVISLIRKLNNEGHIPYLIWDREPNRELLVENNLEVKFQKINFKFSSKLIKKLPFSFRYLLWPFNYIDISKLNFDFIYSFTSYIVDESQTNHLIYLSGPPLLNELDYKPNRFKLIRKIIKILSRKSFSTLQYQEKLKYVINSIFTRDIFYNEYDTNLEVIYPANQYNYSLINHNLRDRNLVTFFSRIVDYKRPNLLIELASKYPKLKFVIMGGVSQNQQEYFNNLRDLIISKSLKNISFEINPSTSLVEKILSKTKIYFFPAVDEHFGITTIEAILKGAIPFVHDSGGQREIVFSSTLKFNDTNLFKKFDKLIYSTDKELEEIQKAQYIYSKQFSNEIFQTKMYSYIDEL